SCRKGGLGVRSAHVHALGAYLSSLASSADLIQARFPSVRADLLDLRVKGLTEDWSKAFGKVPTQLTQRDLSTAADDALLPLLLGSPECPPPAWIASVQSPRSSCFWRCLKTREPL